ncbi:MAG TPA: CehA/McbA family metallohydrolase, partial [Gemmatimonadaceae bacterium]|nr:CehA/McbA family metallohydrolase [Gemmatimonadaceae bacterium]
MIPAALRTPLSLVLLVALAPALGAQARWFKGNTHVHTTESDGNGAPLDVARWYREHGYHFVVITDHEKVTDVAPLGAALGAAGRFLVLPGQEITQQVHDSTRAVPRQAHVVSIGATRVVLPLGEKGVARGVTLAATYARNLAEARAAGGLPQVNHPNFRWSVRPADMAELPDSTLFEVWNAQPAINNLGGADSAGAVALSTDALWDTLLTRGRLLFGVASDDAHKFRPDQLEDFEATRPGGGWVMVRADTLSPAAIVGALRAGDFYATTGVLLDDVVRDPREVRLRIAPPSSARDDRRFTTRFVGRGGRTLAEVPGREARYRVRGDEGYVRAIVTDS